MSKKPELLSPAGTLKNMRYAFSFGADAVYAGMPRYSLRVRNNDFLHQNLQIGIHEAHEQNKKFFVAANVMPHNAKVKTFMADLEPVIEMSPDALIMSDPGLIHMVRNQWPEIPVHLSVQMNTVNYAAVRFWQDIGIQRIILSRELSLDEIAEIRDRCPDIELEVFVHGALCIAYSGRCLLSGYFNHRDPNQGTCTNACRWTYSTVEGEENDCGDVVAQQAMPETKNLLLEEKSRLGEYLPIYEDEHGTYIMNSKDLRAVQHVERLTAMGIDSLKIEGRTKSYYYVARTAQIYRQAIDLAYQKQAIPTQLFDELENLSNRGYTEGFYRRHAPQETQNYEYGASAVSAQRFVGEIIAWDQESKIAHIEVKNKFMVGDKLLLIAPDYNQTFILEKMENLQGIPMDVAPGSGHQVKMPLPAEQISKGLLAVYIVE